MGGFWLRLKQRKLVQWAIAWVAFAFALLQGVDIVASRFAWPPSVERYLILALAIGFFVVLVLAWYHGERGAQRVGSMEIMILALLLAIGGGLIWRFGRVAKTRHAVPAAAVAAPAPPVAKPTTLLAEVTANIPQKSVAVLPFANESGNHGEQYFSDGLSEDLINALSQFAGLKVISRNSAFQFRNSKDSSAEIGKLLGVAHLLEGSVQRAGDEVRITATLVNASDGTVLWSQRYDKPYKDLFALQDAITRSVATALKAKLLTTNGAVVQSDRPPSGNLDAYAAFQHGNAYMDLGTEAGCRAAIAAYERAIRLDPRYAVAYASLSSAWYNLANVFSGDPQKQAQEKEKAAADTALKLDPDSSRAHRAHAAWLLATTMDWRGAEAEFQRAARLAPNDAGALRSLASAVAALGQNQRAVDLTRKSLASNPRNAVGYTNLSGYLAALGHLDAARKAVNTAIALQPGSVDQYATLAIVEILAGNPQAALTAAQKEPPGVWHDIAITLALQIGPDKKAADAALRTLVAKYAPNGPYQIAEVYALRRDPDAMFHWLDRAWTARDPGISYLLSDPFILRYRNDPRFAAFCRKVGLPTTTDAVAMK